jgi:hypothetical protein
MSKESEKVSKATASINDETQLKAQEEQGAIKDMVSS